MILFHPATPLVRAALKDNQNNGPWQETTDLIHSYLWACFVSLGGGDMMMVDTDRLKPVEDLRGECELLIRKASNWLNNGQSFISPTAARFSLIHTYRLLLHFGFVKEPVVVKEGVLISLDSLVSIT